MRTLAESFRNAIAGLAYVWTTERNMRLHFAVGALALALAVLGRLPLAKTLFVLSAILVVILSEVVNTAIESLVDLSTTEYHPLAARCKDIAAGAVLLGAGYAALVGLAVFVPELPSLAGNIALSARERPLSAGLWGVLVAVSSYEALARR
ncbi:MAG: diacylglycerol kinase family protein [Ignavibacteriales bacterium]